MSTDRRVEGADPEGDEQISAAEAKRRIQEATGWEDDPPKRRGGVKFPQPPNRGSRNTGGGGGRSGGNPIVLTLLSLIISAVITVGVVFYLAPSKGQLTTLNNKVNTLNTSVASLGTGTFASQSSVTNVAQDVLDLQTMFDTGGTWSVWKTQIDNWKTGFSTDILATVAQFNTVNGTVTGQGTTLAALQANQSALRSDFTGLSNQTATLATTLAALNASFYAHINGSSGNGSTPTPTPTPPPGCVVEKPMAVFPSNGNSSVINGTVLFQWTGNVSGGFTFYFGTSPDSMTFSTELTSDTYAYPFPAPNPNTYYFWRITAHSACGNLSSTWWFKTAP